MGSGDLTVEKPAQPGREPGKQDYLPHQVIRRRPGADHPDELKGCYDSQPREVWDSGHANPKAPRH